MPKHRESYNEQVKAIYAKIPTIACQKKCQAACGIIPVERVELKKIRKKARIDVEPFILSTPEVTMLFDSEKELCPLLSEHGLCTVYEVRPLVCRLFGVVEDFRCPEGCVPSRLLTKEEASEMAYQLRQLK